MMRPRRLSLMMLAIPSLAAAQSASTKSVAPPAPFSVPSWAFPLARRVGPARVVDTTVWHHVPDSPRAFRMKQVSNTFDAPDWFPDDHPPAPASVMRGTRPQGFACAYCHLPNGAGRPENATLAGLPVAYTMRQVQAFRDSTRLASAAGARTNSMHALSANVSDAEVREAAIYFERLSLTRRNRVVEVGNAPKTRIEGTLFAYDGEGTEPIAGRLVEVADEFVRHELRDPTVRYTTYVPIGAIARGRRLATAGPAGAATACAVCHGPQLLGLNGTPPIAGRNPSNLLRQLVNFRTGARQDSLSIAMRPVVNALTIDDMVALAAYVGGLPPARSTKR